MLKILFFGFLALTFSASAQNVQDDFDTKLTGKHMFGVQFIWDGYGTAEITEEDGLLKIIGEQYSNDKEEYVLLDGVITIIDDRNFKVADCSIVKSTIRSEKPETENTIV